MNKPGPIVIIEDDLDDSELLMDVFNDLNYENEVVYFAREDEAYNYLIDPGNQPFLILSDIRLQRTSGFALKDKLQNNKEFKAKCIPYLFITTTTYEQAVFEAYAKSVQGFFLKPASFFELKGTIKTIVEYWQQCIPSRCIEPDAPAKLRT